MARQLTTTDIPLIVSILNSPKIRPHLSGEFVNRLVEERDIDLKAMAFYISDDQNDLAMFDILDSRLHVGHNAFCNPIKQALKNARDIIGLHFNSNPLLDYIVGFTPIDNKATRLFNTKLGFKAIMPIYRTDDSLCYRYELRRKDYETNNSYR